MGKSESDCKTFKCDYANCTKEFTTRFSLRRHYLTHLGVKEHQCHYCGKRFSLAQYLKEHIYIHTGEKPFICKHPGCGRRFRQAGKLSIHKKSHSEIVPQPNYFVKFDSSEDSIQNVKLEQQAESNFSEQLSHFQIPDFFFSKNLPIPSSLQESPVVTDVIYEAQRNYIAKQLQLRVILQNMLQRKLFTQVPQPMMA